MRFVVLQYDMITRATERPGFRRRNPQLARMLDKYDREGPEEPILEPTPKPTPNPKPKQDINTKMGLARALGKIAVRRRIRDWDKDKIGALDWDKLAKMGSILRPGDLLNWPAMSKGKQQLYATLYQYHPSLLNNLPYSDDVARLAIGSDKAGGKGNRPVPIGKMFGGVKR